MGTSTTPKSKARANERKYRDIFENALIGIFQSTPDGRLLEVNPYFARIAGFDSPEEMVTRVQDIARELYVNSKEREKLKKRLARHGKVEGVEVQVYRKDHSRIWISLTMQTVRDSAGQVLYYQGMFREITERKRMEETLRNTQRRLEIIFDTVPAQIWQKDLDGKYVAANKAFCRTFGFTREDILGKTDHTLFPPEVADRFVSDDHRVLRSGVAEFGIEELVRKASGGPGWNLTDKMVYRDDDGAIAGTIGFALDITRRKLAEEALKQSKERLRALSARIQSIRENERETISREIHDDLGQQLTGLKMDLSWLVRHLRPDQGELIEKVRGMGRRIEQTVHTIRRISSELRPRILDDFGLVAALEWQAEEFTKRTDIPCRFQSNLRELDLKPDLAIAVFRIFQEALTNVVRHSQATRVEASLKRNAREIALTVQDNGRGISEKELERSQSLGLVGMRERALIFGGKVTIRGRKGKGTTVTLRLPVPKNG